MFSIPWRKKQPSLTVNDPISATIPRWLKPLLRTENDISKPDWSEIYSHIERNNSVADTHETWTGIAHSWMGDLVTNLAHEYTKTESDNFILISTQDPRYNKLLCVFLERCRRRLLSVAKDIVRDQGLGKHLVIVFADIDSYYDYVAQYGSEGGTYGLSSGMYLNYGYGHFVFQQDNLEMAEPIAAHEMTHALLEHLPIPNWLNEGLAVNMEAVITGHSSGGINRSYLELHQEFWGEAEIQEFWSGDAFFRADEGQKLSYQLAQVLVTNLSKNYDPFVDFANHAHYHDGGEAAMQETYGFSLGDLVSSVLGEGPWVPKPESW